MITSYNIKRYNKLRANFDEYYSKNQHGKSLIVKFKFVMAMIVYTLLIINNLVRITRMNFVTGIMLMIASFIMADFFSGILHWVCDSYEVHPFLVETPHIKVFGDSLQEIFDGFKLHHHRPSTILNHSLIDHSLDLFIFSDIAMSFLGFFNGWNKLSTMFINMSGLIAIWSNTVHKFAHMKYSDRPFWVKILHYTKIISLIEIYVHH